MLICGGGAFYESALINAHDGETVIGVLPDYSQSMAAGQIRISVDNGNVCRVNDGAHAVNWGQDCDIIIRPPELKQSHSPVTLAQLNTKKALVTYYDDGKPHIMCEGSSFFVKDAPRLTDPTIKSRTLNCGELVTLSGMTSASERYLLALLSTDKWRVLHELTADDIDIRSDCIITRELIADMRRHEIVSTITPESTTRQYNITCRHTYIEQLVPYLFLEALLIGDDREAASYLSPPMGADIERMREFAGKYDTVVCPPYGGSGVAVYDSSLPVANPLTIQFEMRSGLIVNAYYL